MFDTSTSGVGDILPIPSLPGNEKLNSQVPTLTRSLARSLSTLEISLTEADRG